MTLPSSGQIALIDIQTEFGGPSPVALENYYRGAGYTTNNNTNVPTSGTISLQNFYGASKQGSATGGTIYDISGYRYNVFTNSGTLTVVSTIASADILVLGGGGGGGSCNQNGCTSGGGGAGGWVLTSQALSIGAYPAVIGAGGAANSNGTGGYNQPGGNSTFNGLTSYGGGGGGQGGGDQSGDYHNPQGNNGGCGAGGGGQGGSDHSHGNGGGGSGSQGGSGQSASGTGGAGGGVANTGAFPGQGNPYGGLYFYGFPTQFGVGGYGYVAAYTGYGANTGYGGCGVNYGGGSYAQTGCSGIVIVRYPYTP